MIRETVETLEVLRSILAAERKSLQTVRDYWLTVPPSQKIQFSMAIQRTERIDFLCFCVLEDIEQAVTEFKTASIEPQTKASE